MKGTDPKFHAAVVEGVVAVSPDDHALLLFLVAPVLRLASKAGI